MSQLWQPWADLLTMDNLTRIAMGAVIMVAGLIVARIGRWLARRMIGRRLSAQHSMLLGTGVFYSTLGLTVLVALRAAGVDSGMLLGAAGILTVALGFASQTAASNLISGLFLVGERSFEVGDLVKVGTTEGYVVSIDLFAARLRTFDNVLVRLPNETLLKSEIINLTHFPIRRYDLLLGVAYKEDLDRVRSVLMAVAERNPLCLDEPKPVFFVKDFADSAVLVRFSAWFTQENYWESQNRLLEQIKSAFDEAGIEIPFPHRSLYTGSRTEPMPVRIVGEKAVGDP